VTGDVIRTWGNPTGEGDREPTGRVGVQGDDAVAPADGGGDEPEATAVLPTWPLELAVTMI
jgi:hypothetical protein